MDETKKTPEQETVKLPIELFMELKKEMDFIPNDADKEGIIWAFIGQLSQ